MIKNYDEFVNETNSYKLTDDELVQYGLDNDQLQEDVYESLHSWVAHTMETYRDVFYNDDELINFIKFQLESCADEIEDSFEKDKKFVDHHINFYCR